MSVEERIEGEIKEKIKVLIIREIQRRLEKQRREMWLEMEIQCRLERLLREDEMPAGTDAFNIEWMLERK